MVPAGSHLGDEPHLHHSAGTGHHMVLQAAGKGGVNVHLQASSQQTPIPQHGCTDIRANRSGQRHCGANLGRPLALVCNRPELTTPSLNFTPTYTPRCLAPATSFLGSSL